MAAKNTAALNYDAAKQFVKDADAARRKAAMDALKARAAEMAKDENTQRVGIAAAGLGIGALAYHLIAG